MSCTLKKKMSRDQWILDIGLAVRVFANGPGDLGSIPGRVIPKTQKMVLDASLLNTQHYKVRIKGKVEPSREGVAPSPTSWCSSYRKGSLRVTLDYGRQIYFIIETLKIINGISNYGWHFFQYFSSSKKFIVKTNFKRRFYWSIELFCQKRKKNWNKLLNPIKNIEKSELIGWF